MAYDIRIIDIMKEIGCTDGFHIPVANEENRLLENEIKELLEKKARLLVVEERLDNELMEKKNTITHLSNYKDQNQKLILANRQQYEMDQHLLITAQRENDSLSRDNKISSKKLKELTDNRIKVENDLTKSEEQIKKLRETIEWGEETLLAWNDDLAKRNTDVSLVEMYNLEDNKRFKELDLQRQHLQRDVIERESIVEKEVNDLLRVERELDQTSKLIKQAQNERCHLLEQWENAANFFNSNQKEIQNIVSEINKIKEASLEVYDKMNEDKQLYQESLEANEELACDVNETFKANDQLKLKIRKQLKENENLQCEVSVAQATLNNLGNTIANERTKRKHMENEVTKLKTQIQKKTEDIEEIKEKLASIKNQSMTTEERLHELDKIYEDQKSTSERILSDKVKVENTMFKVKNEIKQLQSKIDLLMHQIERNRGEQNILSKEESKLRQLIMDKKEMFYNLSYQLETIKTKISEAEGTVDIEEMNRLQEKMKSLNGEIDQAKKNRNKLEKQLKSLDNEAGRLIKEIDKNNIELETVKNRGEELSISSEGVAKQILSLKEQNHRYHMEEMMLRLKVEQMKKLTNNECEKVYSLAQQREELNAGINKRKAEVAAIYDRMNAEKKLLMEEKSAVRRKLDATMQKIEQRQSKYQILLATLTYNGEGFGNGDGYDDDQSFALSEHRIRVAREKLELQDMGDQLDERVQKLENEIRAMENTLHVLNATNICYKSNLSSINPESDEYKDKIFLDEEYEKYNSMWFQKKKLVKKIDDEIQELQVKIEKATEELESLINIRDVKNSEYDRGLKDIDEQLVKINRVDSRIQFSMKTVDKSCNDPEKRNTLALIKRDITVRMMKKANKSVLEMLSEMSVRHIGLEPTIKQYLSEKDLKLPTVSSLLSLNKMKSSYSSSVTSLNSNNSSMNTSVLRAGTNEV